MRSPQKAEWICSVVGQVWALAWARAWQEESVRTRRRSAASLAKIRTKTKTSVSWCCCWRRVRAGCVARQQAHGTIDWAPQAETSQFRAPVSRDRLGLLSYKIPPLFFSHLPKKVHFSFPKQMFFFFFILFSSGNFEILGWKEMGGRQMSCLTWVQCLCNYRISLAVIRLLRHVHVVK